MREMLLFVAGIVVAGAIIYVAYFRSDDGVGISWSDDDDLP